MDTESSISVIGLTELVDESPGEKLMDFILKSGCSPSFFSTAYEIFNKEIDLLFLTQHISQFLKEEFRKFSEIIGDDIIMFSDIEYVHLGLIGVTTQERSRITRKINSMDFSKYRFPKGEHCPVHSQPCVLVQKPCAFLFYLYLLVDLKENQDEDDEGQYSNIGASLLKDVMNEPEDIEEPLDPDSERKESAKFDVAKFKAETIIEEVSSLDEDVTESSFNLTTLPSLHISGRNYLLLPHIQKLYNLREDYCLAIIAEGCDIADGFIDIENEHKEEFLKLDTETSNKNFLEAPDALAMCLAKSLGEPPALKDEDFERRLEELGIATFGREEKERPMKEELTGTLNLWRASVLEEDENQKVSSSILSHCVMK